jgi:hypothetical protein
MNRIAMAAAAALVACGGAQQQGFDLSPGSTLKTAEAINIGTLVGTFTATGCHVPATECSGS